MLAKNFPKHLVIYKNQRFILSFSLFTYKGKEFTTEYKEVSMKNDGLRGLELSKNHLKVRAYNKKRYLRR